MLVVENNVENRKYINFTRRDLVTPLRMRRQRQRDNRGRRRVGAEMLPNRGWTILGMSSAWNVFGRGRKLILYKFPINSGVWKFREIVEGHPKGQSNPKAEGASAAGKTTA